MLLCAVGVNFEYRNLVISCSCLSHFNGFLCCEGQDHSCCHGLQGPACFSPCQLPTSFSAPQPITLTPPAMTISCSSRLWAFASVIPSPGNLLLLLLCYVCPAHYLDLSTSIIYLKKIPLNPPYLFPIHPHKIRSPQLLDLIELYFPIIAFKF